MATYYPKISANTNSKLNLFTDSNDSAFDSYVFTDPNTGSQVAYMLFVIKNTHTSASSNLVITDIVGGGSFDDYFTIDPVVPNTTDLLLGLGSTDNLLQGVSSNIGNTGYGANETTDASTGECTGASAFIGHVNGLEQDSAAGANETNSQHLVPIYKTSDIKNNSIPAESYAVFLIKFHPTEVLNLNGEAFLTIKNNDTDIVINFTATVRNPLSYYGVVGTATKTVNGDDSFSTTPGIPAITDNVDGTQDPFKLGIYPYGYNYGSQDRTIMFDDFSNNSGNYQYSVHGSLLKVIPPGNTSAIDGTVHKSDGNTNDDNSNSLKNNFVHQGGNITTLANCATEGINDFSGAGNATARYTGEAVYKNFSQGNGGYFSKLTHQNPNADSKNTREVALQHLTSGSDCVNEAFYRISKVENTTNPELTAAGTNNSHFVFSVSLGYYSPITFNSSITEEWVKSRRNNANYYSDLVNVDANPSGEVAPWFRSDSGYLTRGGTFNLNLHFRYNYFNEDGLDGEPFTFDNFILDNEILTIEHGSNSKPRAYTSGVNNEITNHLDIPPSETSVSNTTYSVFSDSSNNGTILGLHYNITIDQFYPSHMYPNYSKNDNRYITVADSSHSDNFDYSENYYGAFTTYVTPKYNNSKIYNSLFYQEGHGSVQYKVGFLPKWSYLRLLSSSSDNVLNSKGVMPVPLCKLFKDDVVSDLKNYSMLTEKVYLDNSNDWRLYNTTTATSSNTDQSSATEATEGKWYGAGIASVLRPPCWDFDSDRSDGGSMAVQIDHNIQDWKRRFNTGASYANRWYEENVNYYFKLPSASYNSTAAKWRSVGRFYFDNTGDYPIYMQQIEVKTKNFDLCNLGDDDHYQRTADAILPKTLDSNDNEVAPTYVPSPGNSATPTWGISKGRYDGDQVNDETTEVWKDTALSEGSGYSNDTVRFPNNLGENGRNAHQHYVFDNLFNNTNNYSSVSNANKALTIEPQVENNTWTRISNDDHGVKSKTFDNANKGLQNYIDVTFELDPTNVSAYDNGTYYAQICMTYYVDDYESRWADEVDSNGNVTHIGQYPGQNHNAHTRLRVSKYLIAVDLLSEAEIRVVDSEDDAAPTTIEIPAIITG